MISDFAKAQSILHIIASVTQNNNSSDPMILIIVRRKIRDWKSLRPKIKQNQSIQMKSYCQKVSDSEFLFDRLNF